MRCTVLLLALALVVSACGGDTPTAPSPPVPQIPQVAGTYTGPATFAATLPGISEAGTGEIGVTQAGSTVTLAAVEAPSSSEPLECAQDRALFTLALRPEHT